MQDTLARNNNLYAPAYLDLLKDSKKEPPPYKRKQIRTSKGKKKAVTYTDVEFEKEKVWIEKKLGELLLKFRSL